MSEHQTKTTATETETTTPDSASRSSTTDESAAHKTLITNAKSATLEFFSTPSTRWLGGLLIFQLVVAGVLFWQGQQQGAVFDAPTSVANVDADAVDTITLHDGTDSLTLRRTDEHWLLPDEPSLPADEASIGTLINTINDLSAGLPVATTEASRAQLDVAEDDYQRRIELSGAGEILADLYVGSSPGFRKAHVRRADDEAIYASAINVFDIPVSGDEWLDQSVLAASDVSRIEAATYALEKTDDAWSLPGKTDETHELNEDKVADLVRALENLTVDGVLAPDADHNDSDGEGSTVAQTEAADVDTDNSTLAEAAATDQSVVVEFKLSDAAGERSLILHKVGDSYRVSRDDIAAQFSISQTQFDALVGVTVDDLWVEKPAEDEIDEEVDDPTNESSDSPG